MGEIFHKTFIDALTGSNGFASTNASNGTIERVDTGLNGTTGGVLCTRTGNSPSLGGYVAHTFSGLSAVRKAWFMDFSALVLGADNALVTLWNLRDGANANALGRIRLTQTSSVPRCLFEIFPDNGGILTVNLDFTNKPAWIEAEIIPESTDGAADGEIRFYFGGGDYPVTGQLVAEFLTLQNYVGFNAVTQARMGMFFGSTTISGSLKLDEIYARNANEPILYSEVPTLTDFGEYHTVIDGSTSGWDQYFENIGAVIKFGSTYFLYYVAGDADADIGDDYVHNRQLGVATSPDGVNWTKYAGNPILSFTPEGDQVEEGIGGCVAVVHDGQVHMYYTALRWRSGGDVDAEIRYVVSDDGFNFSGDTLILDNEGDEFYSCGVYVDSSDVFHVYYVGPLTGGVGDLKRLSGSTPNAVSANGTVSTSDFSSIGGVIDLTASMLLFYNDADPLDGTTTQYLMSKSALGTLGSVVQSLDPNPSALLQFSPKFLKDGDQWFYYLTLSASEEAPYSNRQIICRAYPTRPAFQLLPSSNIAASAATDTTAILTAPAGKTTGDFEAGKISDDTNPLPSINLTDGAYTEVEFCHEPTEYAEFGGTYEFRITDNGTPLDTYTEYAELTIAAAGVEGSVVVTGSGSVSVAGQKDAQSAVTVGGSGSVSVAGQKDAQGAMVVTGSGQLTANGQKDAQGLAAIIGQGSVSATGSVVESYSGSVAVAGQGQLTADGQKDAQGSVAITGQGSVSVAGQKNGQGSVAITGGGSISATGSSVENHSGSVVVTGRGQLTAEGQKNGQGLAAITGQGQLEALGVKQVGGIVSVSGGGFVSLSALKAVSGFVSISGSGSISINEDYLIEQTNLIGRVLAQGLTGPSVSGDSLSGPSVTGEILSGATVTQ